MNESEKHEMFDEDPGDLMQYVYKEIEIITCEGRLHRGWVYTIDPVSLSFGIVQFAHERVTQVELIMGHAIKHLAVVNDDISIHKEDLDSLFKPATGPAMSSEELASRQQVVKNWLMKHRIPVETCNEQPELLSLGDVLRISPPYLAENCQSSNERILDAIQRLLRKMPDVNDESLGNA